MLNMYMYVYVYSWLSHQPVISPLNMYVRPHGGDVTSVTYACTHAKVYTCIHVIILTQTLVYTYKLKSTDTCASDIYWFCTELFISCA